MEKPFTIFAPLDSAENGTENDLEPDDIKSLIYNHVVGETIPETSNITDTITISTIKGETIKLESDGNGNITANGRNIVDSVSLLPHGVLLIVDGYLAAERAPASRSQTIRTEPEPKQSNVSPSPAPSPPPPPPTVAPDNEEAAKNQSNTTFVENVMEVLSLLKSRVRVFQHFLSRSNVSRLLNEGEEYTVFVPTDHAFQRWHPIDWGFYPFSVPEFTESVIVNHFVKGRLKQDSIKDGQLVQTMGGREVLFKRTPTLTANGASVLKGDTPLKKGNILFIGEVLFVSESVVSKLHQQHRDKETPPLLAFPWFGAQFLSHAFLALERDKRFFHITRFLNLADLAPHVSGAGYTFFVPCDPAFEELGLDKMPDNYLSNGEGLEILLNHFVKGRLYDKDLKNGTVLTTLGNKTLTINRTADQVHINDALIVESEVFVYNLGTMFYIDKVLYPTIKVPSVPIGGIMRPSATTTTTETPTTKPSIKYTTAKDSEPVTSELEVPEVIKLLYGDGTENTLNSDSEDTTPSSKNNIPLPK
ncbi:hypothetical protein GWI33_020345 [Rhynchophorus ferrugineus]|uniref:FAS1 domain-containing protein n=1 Tax=Rhynchophorus ferrugineus TaxID=354439 RepID=A0A834HSL5_RHYFE|nr:hypothetical protein GWI33_020345 [Rhynchophorus ferrugineus]